MNRKTHDTTDTAAYCLAVCPAGEEMIAPFLLSRNTFRAEVVKPLQDKVETIYVVPGSDAASYVPRHVPHTRIKLVGNGLRPHSIPGFLAGLPNAFQRGQSEGLDATYHFTFTGDEAHTATIVIRDKTLEIHHGHVGARHLHVLADSRTWLGFVRQERSLLWALLSRKIRIQGPPRLLTAFGRCFPS